MSSEGFYIYLMRIGHKKDFMLCIESIVVSFLVLASSRLRLYPSEVIIHAIFCIVLKAYRGDCKTYCVIAKICDTRYHFTVLQDVQFAAI